MAEPEIEVVYIGHDNSVDLRLKEDDSYVCLSAISAMTITCGSLTCSSVNTSTDPITWSLTGYLSGEVRLKLGHQSITAGTYSAPLVVYASDYPNGLVWGSVRLDVIPEVEN